MINKKKDSKVYKDVFERALLKLKQVGYNEIKADIEGFETPAGMVNTATQVTFIPDITCISDGKIHYYEIGQKSDPKNLLISKWKLLEVMAGLKQGVFKVFAPKGHIKFTEEFLANNNITAEVIRI